MYRPTLNESITPMLAAYLQAKPCSELPLQVLGQSGKYCTQLFQNQK